MTSQRRDRHKDPALTVRPDAALKQQATQALSNRDREMKGFVVACLTALVADPDGFLERLDKHWPAEKPRGRPRKAASAQPARQDQQAAVPSGSVESVPYSPAGPGADETDGRAAD